MCFISQKSGGATEIGAFARWNGASGVGGQTGMRSQIANEVEFNALRVSEIDKFWFTMIVFVFGEWLGGRE